MNGIWKNQLGQKLSPPDPNAEDLRKAPERKADRDAICAMLAPVAETLRCHVTLRQELHESGGGGSVMKGHGDGISRTKTRAISRIRSRANPAPLRPKRLPPQVFTAFSL